MNNFTRVYELATFHRRAVSLRYELYTSGYAHPDGDKPMEDWTALEKKIAATMQSTPGSWTEECIDPDDLFALIEEGGEHPDSQNMMAHVIGCAYCRNAYRAGMATLKAASEARDMQTAPQNEKAPGAGTAVWRSAAAGSVPAPELAGPSDSRSASPIAMPTSRDVTSFGRRPSLWQRLSGPALGFAFAAAAALVLYVASVSPRLARLKSAQDDALAAKNELQRRDMVETQDRSRLTAQLKSLQTQTATRSEAQSAFEARARQLQAEAAKSRQEADQLRLALNSLRVPSGGQLLARAEQGTLRVPAPITGLDRSVLRGDAGETEIALSGPNAERVAAYRPVLRWKPLDADVRYHVRIFDSRNHTVAEGTTPKPEWRPEQDLPRDARLRWQVEALRPDSPEPAARSAVASFLVLNVRATDELLRAHLELGARMLEAGSFSEAEREIQSVLDDDPQNRTATKLLAQLNKARSGQ